MVTSSSSQYSFIPIDLQRECFSYKLVFFSSCRGECRKASGSEAESVQVNVCYPTTAAQRYGLGGEGGSGERAGFGDVKSQEMLPVMDLTVSWMATIHVDNVNKMHTEKDNMDRANYSERFASKRVLLSKHQCCVTGTKGKDAQLSTNNAR